MPSLSPSRDPVVGDRVYIQLPNIAKTEPEKFGTVVSLGPFVSKVEDLTIVHEKSIRVEMDWPSIERTLRTLWFHEGEFVLCHPKGPPKALTLPPLDDDDNEQCPECGRWYGE